MQRCLFLAFGWFAAATLLAQNDPTHLYVSPNGDDANPGTKEKPLASLEAARTAIRSLKSGSTTPSPVIVEIAPGLYFRKQTFLLDQQDSGSPEAPIIYRSSESQRPRFIGGMPVRGFAPVTDEKILQRLPPEARSKVKVADLKSQGLQDYGRLMPRGFGGRGEAALELFFNGEPMTLARWPNEGWMTINALPDGKDGSLIRYEGDRPQRWIGAEDPWLFGYWYHGWADQFLPVAALEPAHQQIRLKEKHGYGFREGQRFFALNLLEELDLPGEWHLNRTTGRLYFWPPTPEGETIVSVLDQPLVRLTDASHVRFERLQLEATRDTGVIVENGSHVGIVECVIRNVGAHGVSINGGINHRVESCDIAYPGERGISMSGGNRQTLEAGNHVAIDNHIHHFGRTRRTYQPAISLSGVGLRAAHNLIHDAPHMAIGFGGNDHLIEFNEIHHVLLETDDAGAMYTGRNWTTRGHVIQYNYLHHSGPWHAPRVPEERRASPHVVYEPLHRHGVNLLYFDDAASGITVTGNVLHDAGRAVMIGGGRDHLVQNNLIIGGKIGIWIDARGIGWAKEHIRPGGGWRMYDKLANVNHDRPPYSRRYPGLATILDENPHQPMGNRIERNLLVNVEEWRHLQSAEESWITFDNNAVISDTQVNIERPADLARNLKNSWTAQANFEPLPFERIGLKRPPPNHSQTRP